MKKTKNHEGKNKKYVAYCFFSIDSLRSNNEVVKPGNNFKELVDYEDFVNKVVSEGELDIF